MLKVTVLPASQAREQLYALLERVAAGEEVIITRQGTPFKYRLTLLESKASRPSRGKHSLLTSKANRKKAAALRKLFA